MLVLSRKTNESIMIDHNIKVVVLEIQGNKVRLGFEAPQDVPIHREELQAKTRQDHPVTWDVLPTSGSLGIVERD